MVAAAVPVNSSVGVFWKPGRLDAVVETGNESRFCRGRLTQRSILPVVFVLLDNRSSSHKVMKNK
jgi:hypothetical protein